MFEYCYSPNCLERLCCFFKKPKVERVKGAFVVYYQLGHKRIVQYHVRLPSYDALRDINTNDSRKPPMLHRDKGRAISL